MPGLLRLAGPGCGHHPPRPSFGPAEAACLVIVVFVWVYSAAACAVFQYRHPWMTDTEKAVYIGSALSWSGVSYDAARTRR